MAPKHSTIPVCWSTQLEIEIVECLGAISNCPFKQTEIIEQIVECDIETGTTVRARRLSDMRF